MTSITEVQAQAEAIKAEADKNAAAVNTAVSLLQVLSATVADLKAQLAGGAAVTQAQLDALGATLAGAQTELVATDAELASGTAAATPTA